MEQRELFPAPTGACVTGYESDHSLKEAPLVTDTLNKPLSGAGLKVIACAAMLADHLCKALSVPAPVFLFLSSVIGRIAFPIFCFLLAEGFFYTRSRGRYIRNLLILAVLSEVPFDLALHRSFFDPGHQNTCFTLLLGLILFTCLDLIERKNLSLNKSRAAQAAVLALFAAAAWLLRSDYGAYGICCLAAFYYFRTLPVQATFLGCFLLNLDGFGAPAAFLALIPVYLYNGKRGTQLKYGFYIFYPLHLLLLKILISIFS